jgi:hypothetical protein
LLYKAYEAFFLNLPNVVALAEKQKLTVGQVTIANVIIGAVSLVLVVAALILAWDAVKAFQRYRAEVAASA